MNSLEQFNKFYAAETTGIYETSLLDFYKTKVACRLSTEGRVLDLGPGSKSIFEDIKIEKSLITAIDFSQKALDLASPHSLIDYRLGNISKDTGLKDNSFNLIFDSHCLHCITAPSEREIAFKNIIKLMKPDGLFASEMMVQRGNLSIDLPFKHVPNALLLEKEILEHGFKIEFFMIGSELSFSNAHGECDVLRVICSK